MAAKGAVRDVGRVLDFGYNFCDGISKLIPFKPGKLVTIADAIKEEPQLADRQENEEEVRQLLDLAQQVEGIARNIGMHRSEEHTSELQSLMRISYAVSCLTNK